MPMENRLQTKIEGKYIYGIIKNENPVSFGYIGMGNPAEKVYSINFRDISAVVSNSSVVQFDTRRINLITHEKVLETVMKQFTILPACYSTISKSSSNDKIRYLLEKNYDQFCKLLIDLQDMKEMGIKVLVKKEAFFENIMENYDEIRNLKRKLEKLSFDQTHYQRLKIGEMVAVAFENESDRYRSQIITMLSSIADKMKINDNFGDTMILNAAFLINKNDELQFDEAVNELYNRMGHLLTIKYVGTLPPYNFVNLGINTKGN